MARIKWENSRKGSITDANGMNIKIHIRKPFKTALTYGVFLDDNKTSTFSKTTIEEARKCVEELFGGVK